MLGDNATVLIVALIIAVVIVFNNLMARKERAAPVGSGRDDGHDLRALLSKFVHHDGHVVGETVALDGDRLILKQAGAFKAVPHGAARIVEDEVQLLGDIDWPAAEAAGAAWRNANTRGADDSVAGDLTRSEDVRKPALEAMKARLDEEE